jgi:hypothetical protein
VKNAIINGLCTVRDGDNHRDEQSTQHRRRNVVRLEDRNRAAQSVPEEKRHAAERERMNEVELQHVQVPFELSGAFSH